MNCSRAREFLALYAGGDLTEAEIEKVHAHMHQCRDCRRFHEGLASNQSLLRSLRSDAVPSAALTEMRQGLFSRLDEARVALGWWVRLERFLLLELRRPRYAVAGAALAALLSATLFSQLRHVAANPDSVAAVLDNEGALRLPENYREWVLISGSMQLTHPAERTGNKHLRQNVYMSPGAYRDYLRTGAFPEGTITILESANAPGQTDGGSDGHHAENMVTLASVKDQRFNGGWAYFRFNGSQRGMAAKAQALPETAGCVACHRDRGATDHVFTQFYPVLRSASGVL